jgi:hypothetical protein
MSAIVHAIAPARRHQTAPGFALVPQNMREAMDFADMMARNGLLPPHLRGQPGACLMIIEQAGRWHMSPFQVAMKTSVIAGKIMHERQLIAAAVNTQPGMIGRLNYEYTSTGDDRAVTVSGMLRGEAKPRTVSVCLRDARTANEMWKRQPDQQLAYHGARVWARRHTPEVIMGVYAPEEFGAAMPAHTGPTLEAVAEPMPVNDRPVRVNEHDTAVALNDSIPSLDDEPAAGVSAESTPADSADTDTLRAQINAAVRLDRPQRPSVRCWLQSLESRLAACGSREETEALLLSNETCLAAKTLRGAARERLRAIMNGALEQRFKW